MGFGEDGRLGAVVVPPDCIFQGPQFAVLKFLFNEFVCGKKPIPGLPDESGYVKQPSERDFKAAIFLLDIVGTRNNCRTEVFRVLARRQAVFPLTRFVFGLKDPENVPPLKNCSAQKLLNARVSIEGSLQKLINEEWTV